VTEYAFSFVALTAFVAVLLGILAFALLRFRAAALQARRSLSDTGKDTMMLSMALQETLSRLKAQEQETSARAAASEQLSTQVFDSLTAGLVVVDAAACVQIVNPAACRMLGIDRAPVGRPYRELFEAAIPLADVLGEGLRTQAAIVRRSVQVRRDGQSWYFGVTVSPFGAPASSRGAICLFSDLTAIVDLEEQLQLREALARLGELTAGIAHEFRNGLATIHGYSRLIDPRALPPAYQPYLEGIRQETEALGRVVTNFLAYARPEKMAFLPVDLEAVARHTADDLHVELPAGTRVEVCGPFGKIHGDEVLLRQVFANLIRNAAEACAGADRVPAIAVGGRADAGQQLAFVSVQDNGPGIPEADRARIFQPFVTTRARGSGLGLSIVQKIVLLHNGRVTVGASESGGARIDMSFPLAG
jgi:PAS domain S-box-containing protein